jgi:serine/threonine protein kinase/tetratricopeptide (TPR) repeat protein
VNTFVLEPLMTVPSPAEAVYFAAAALPDAERAAYLDHACAGNGEMRRQVERMLRARHDVGDFLELPPTAEASDSGPVGAATADCPEKDVQAGSVIAGKYTLVERVGEGGMGSVWRARQNEPVKRFVAVKLVKAGMDSMSVLARFDAERQALALMEHPNIAKILDGGLHENRPYFVMELVKGTPITHYCDSRRLTPRERLELFVPVCQAIQHAHQKGIIHRDVKPTNVLVALYDDKAVVKVIDFGIAKATGASLTERTIDTGFGGVVGTPEYMSPEQATFNNLDVDTRSDVYALGVLLYELLTGSPPFSKKELEKRGLLEMLRVVREEEPPRPSTRLSTADALPTLSANRGTEPKKLTGLLRNELDWIVMKALEKDRSRRYETANGFAADVLRYLGGEPVQAHPPSAAYRLKKFVRRYRGPVVSASVVLATMVAGIVGTTWGLIEAKRQERIADARRADAEGAQAAERTRAEGERNAKNDALRQKAAVERQIRETKGAQSIVLLGLRTSLQDWPRRRSDETPERPVSAERLLDGVVESLDSTLPTSYENEPFVQASARGLLAWLLEGFDLLEPARRQYVAALALYQGQARELAAEESASLQYGLSEILYRLGDFDEAEPVLREVVNKMRKSKGEKDVITRKASNRLAETLVNTGKLDEAVRTAEHVLKIGRSTVGDDDETTQESMEILGRAYSLQGKWANAEKEFARALEHRRRINTPEHPPRLEATEEFGRHYLRRAMHREAAALFRESLEARQNDAPDSWAAFNTQSLLGAALLGQNKYDEAAALLINGYEGMKRREQTSSAAAAFRLVGFSID